jgi:hypothetical protein
VEHPAIPPQVIGKPRVNLAWLDKACCARNLANNSIPPLWLARRKQSCRAQEKRRQEFGLLKRKQARR